MSKQKRTNLSTSLQHAGSQFRLGKGLVGAIDRSVTFKTANETDPPVYARLGNTTNHAELEYLLAALYHTKSAIVVNSGMSAWTLTFLGLAKPGDEILCPKICYGGSVNFFTKIMAPWGLRAHFAPFDQWERFVTDRTKFILIESISNPFCEPIDIDPVMRFAQKHKLMTLCDNTFASPVLFNPLAHGCDLVLESATKYLNGHADVIAGLIAGSDQWIKPLRAVHAYLGTFLPQDQCALLIRGLKTLEIRMRAQTENAAWLQKELAKRPEIKAVHYGDQKDDAIQKLFSHGMGAMLAFTLCDKVKIQQFLKNLKVVRDVPSLGSTETTLTAPAFTTHWFMPEDERKALGITSQLVRLSVGLEDPRDVLHDIVQAAATH
jgi:cysteine-S-conjugate beta-lyase